MTFSKDSQRVTSCKLFDILKFWMNTKTQGLYGKWSGQWRDKFETNLSRLSSGDYNEQTIYIFGRNRVNTHFHCVTSG